MSYTSCKCKGGSLASANVLSKMGGDKSYSKQGGSLIPERVSTLDNSAPNTQQLSPQMVGILSYPLYDTSSKINLIGNQKIFSNLDQSLDDMKNYYGNE